MGSEGEAGEFPYMVDPLAPLGVPQWKEVLYIVSCAFFGLTTVVKNLYAASRIKSRFLMKRYSGKQIFGWSAPIPIQLMKEIRRGTRANVPTILSSVALGALKALDEAHPLKAERMKSLALGLVGAILPYPDLCPKNRFTVVNFSSSGIREETRLKCLLATKREMRKLARDPDALVNYTVFRLLGKFPAFLVQLVMGGGSMSVVFSNVPWARKRVQLWGQEVEEVAGWMPLLTTAGEHSATFQELFWTWSDSNLRISSLGKSSLK
jgi:hypothetical protein